MGTLGVDGGANLFLLNPNGIIFGEDARLDVSGSFTASTAASILFPNNVEFSATNPQGVPLLNIGTPQGVQYGPNSLASIINRGELSVGQDLSLLGAGNIIVTGLLSTDNEENRAAGDIELFSNAGSISISGDISADSNNDDVPGFPVIRIEAPQGFVRLDDATVSSDNQGSRFAGDIFIGARDRILLTNNSRISSNGKFGRVFLGSGVGNIIITSPQNIIINDSSVVTRNTGDNIENEDTRSGDITITATNLFRLENGASLSTSTVGNGNAGSIEINADDAVSISGENTRIFNQVLEDATGDGGPVEINTASFTLTEGAQMSASTDGMGDAGSIEINASDTVNISGETTRIFNQVRGNATGDGGPVEIDTTSFTLENGARISVSTFGNGNAGSINIDSTSRVRLSDAIIFNNVAEGGVGNAGDIDITVEDGSFTLINDSQIQARVEDVEVENSEIITNGGAINVEANNVSLRGARSRISTSLGQNATGRGGDIIITTGSLHLEEGADLVASTSGNGNAGLINVTANNEVFITGNGTGLFNRVEEGARGIGGAIIITTDSFRLEEGADLSASTDGAGNAGSIRITANDEVVISGDSTSIFSQVLGDATGDGGTITITTDSLSILDSASIEADSTGNSQVAGSIIILVNCVILDDGSITAESRSGKGGNITLLALNPEQETFLIQMRNGSTISAEALDDAVGGNVFINDNTQFNENNEIISSNTIRPTGFILATQDDNDIIASADENRGGNIRINVFGIFGLEERDSTTDFSDINATSRVGLDGEIVLNTLNIDPTRGLGDLPIDIVDASSLVAEGCVGTDRRGVETQGEFTRTGRGGLSPDPTGVLTDDALIDQSAASDDSTLAESSSTPAMDSETLVEAQGLGLTDSGKVSLVSADVTPRLARLLFPLILAMPHNSFASTPRILTVAITLVIVNLLSSSLKVKAAEVIDNTVPLHHLQSHPSIPPVPAVAASTIDNESVLVSQALPDNVPQDLPPLSDQIIPRDPIFPDADRLPTEPPTPLPSPEQLLQPSGSATPADVPADEEGLQVVFVEQFRVEGSTVFDAEELAALAWVATALSSDEEIPDLILAYCPEASSDLPEAAEEVSPDISTETSQEITESTQTTTNNVLSLSPPQNGQDLSFAQLLRARSTITQLYIKCGYITSGAILPPQIPEEEENTVIIQVVEGRLEEIEVTGLTRLDPGYVSSRLAIAGSEPLKQDQLLQGLQLLQLNPLIRRISADLQTGTRPATSILQVEAIEADPFYAELDLNNNRSPSVGSFQRGITFTHANLLGVGDGLSVTYNNTDGSNGVEGSYTIPVNPYNGTVNLRAGYTRSEVIEPPFDALDITSDSSYYEVTIRQPIFQSPTEEFALGLTVSQQESQTELGIKDIGPFSLSRGADEDGRTRISAVRFTQDWLKRTPRRVLAARSQFSVGVDFLDATINDDPLPDSRFFAWRGQGQWVQLLDDSGTLLLARTDMQLTGDSLLPLEQFGIGGQDTVRGYRQDALLTDNGIYASVEVRFPVVKVRDVQGTLYLVPFLDAGTGWNVDSSTNPEDTTLIGTGLGLLWTMSDDFTTRLDWGIPLISIDSRERTWQESGVYFSIQYSPF